MSDDHLTGKIIGWRTWSVDGSGELQPIVLAGHPWKPGVNTAECHISNLWMAGTDDPEPDAHAAPDHNCECGLYASYKSAYVPTNPTPPQISGVVLAWGDVELHATGFRAQHPEVLCLVVADDAPDFTRRFVEQVAETYGVPAISCQRAASYAMEFGRTVPKKLMPEGFAGVVYSNTPVYSTMPGWTIGPGAVNPFVTYTGTLRLRPPSRWLVGFHLFAAAVNGGFGVAGSEFNFGFMAFSVWCAAWLAAQRKERRRV